MARPSSLSLAGGNLILFLSYYLFPLSFCLFSLTAIEIMLQIHYLVFKESENETRRLVITVKELNGITNEQINF